MTCSVSTHCELHRQTHKQTSLTPIRTTTVQSCWKHREMLASEWSDTHREHCVIQARTAGSLCLNNCMWVFNELSGNMLYASVCLFSSVMFYNWPPVRAHSKQMTSAFICRNVFFSLSRRWTGSNQNMVTASIPRLCFLHFSVQCFTASSSGSFFFHCGLTLAHMLYMLSFSSNL